MKQFEFRRRENYDPVEDEIKKDSGLIKKVVQSLSLAAALFSGGEVAHAQGSDLVDTSKAIKMQIEKEWKKDRPSIQINDSQIDLVYAEALKAPWDWQAEVIIEKSDNKSTVKEDKLKLTYVGLEALGLGQYQVFTPEYAWVLDTRKGKLSGFGFIELPVHGNTFTNHDINYKPSSKLPVSFGGEIGAAGKASFGAVGVKYDLHSIGPVNKVFNSATVQYLHKAFGVSPNHEIVLVWGTKSVAVAPGVSVESDGFYRIHAGQNYGQTDVNFSIPKTPKWLKARVEAKTLGDPKSWKYSFGIKISKVF